MDYRSEERIDDTLFQILLANLIKNLKKEEIQESGNLLGERISDDFFLKSHVKKNLTLESVCMNLIPDFYYHYFTYKIKPLRDDSHYIFSFDDFYVLNGMSLDRKYDVCLLFKHMFDSILSFLCKNIGICVVCDENGCKWKVYEEN
ncbi:hypothetical protein EDEG_00167 [Edhazardia aedis USNM 41457]|uniref:4-vinyl reductase 4VR domain-containing protein n=1 Tax=Edhazardia aedis (strain USNM 41457) TaxID=1003232 RepID=J9D847_EDHAE|nr:hypothetical protein EDEG_00167 [Edhazardia aedis USNM 41457]|eukprot:EJW03679.1 hypothetical protein EDEG_00167 [Edhazardia aedis USNM 41457]